jgi:hypothetical protein
LPFIGNVLSERLQPFKTNMATTLDPEKEGEEAAAEAKKNKAPQDVPVRKAMNPEEVKLPGAKMEEWLAIKMGQGDRVTDAGGSKDGQYKSGSYTNPDGKTYEFKGRRPAEIEEFLRREWNYRYAKGEEAKTIDAKRQSSDLETQVPPVEKPTPAPAPPAAGGETPVPNPATDGRPAGQAPPPIKKGGLEGMIQSGVEKAKKFYERSQATASTSPGAGSLMPVSTTAPPSKPLTTTPPTGEPKAGTLPPPPVSRPTVKPTLAINKATELPMGHDPSKGMDQHFGKPGYEDLMLTKEGDMMRVHSAEAQVRQEKAPSLGALEKPKSTAPVIQSPVAKPAAGNPMDRYSPEVYARTQAAYDRGNMRLDAEKRVREGGADAMTEEQRRPENFGKMYDDTKVYEAAGATSRPTNPEKYAPRAVIPSEDEYAALEKNGTPWKTQPSATATPVANPQKAAFARRRR